MENLRILFNTACHEVHGRGVSRVVTYRIGFATPIGNIEKSCWKQLATAALSRKMDVYNAVRSQLTADGKQRSMSEEDFEIAVLSESIKCLCSDNRGGMET